MVDQRRRNKISYDVINFKRRIMNRNYLGREDKQIIGLGRIVELIFRLGRSFSLNRNIVYI